MYTNYCRHSLLCKKKYILCVNVYELSMSINIVQCSEHKRVKGLVSRVHKAPPLSPKLSVTQLTQPTTYSCHTIGSTPTGFCHMVLISFNNSQKKKSNKIIFFKIITRVSRHFKTHSQFIQAIIIVSYHHQTRHPMLDR